MICRRPTIAAKSIRTPIRRKSKSISVIPDVNVVTDILFIHPVIREEQAYKDRNTAYVDTLSNDEQTLVNKCLVFIIAEPKKRKHLHGPCSVIPFLIVNKRLAVMEA